MDDSDTEVLRLSSDERTRILVSRLSVHVGQKTDLERGVHKILDGVSLDIQPGQVLAIMGGSGCGKTTLLNTLAQRLNVTNRRLRFSGKIDYLVGLQNSAKTVRSAYLQQTDIFLPGLTVRETLSFQADLRLPRGTKRLQKDKLMSLLLRVLELEHRASEVIVLFSGDSFLSGGEQRRVSLAIQLLSRPLVLFLDEPTTGLDTSSSLKMVAVLKKLASPEYGVTIVLSIHQPRREIIDMFDAVCLLTRGGRTVYYGSVSEAETYFKEVFERSKETGLFDDISLPHGPYLASNTLLKSEETIAPFSQRPILDLVMALLVKDCPTREQELLTTQKVDLLVAFWLQKTHHHGTDLPADQMEVQFRKNLASFQRPREEKILLWWEIVVLTKRTFILSYRDKQSLLSTIGGCLFLAIACGWIFYKPYPNVAGIRSLTSCLYVMLEVMGFIPLFLELERLWRADGVSFFREYKEDCVSIPGFVISRRLGKLLLEEMPISVIFASITYYMWGLRTTDIYGTGPSDPRFFAAYLGVTILTTYMGMATAFAAFSLTPNLSLSMLVVNCFYQLQNSASGFLINASTMPVYVRWVRYICYFWYAFGAMCSNQFTMWMGACPNSDIYSDECVEYSGEYQLLKLGFPQYWVGVPVGALVAYLAVLYAITFAGLYFRNYDLKVAKTRENTIGSEEPGQEAFQSRGIFQGSLSSEKIANFDISLQHIALSVAVRDPERYNVLGIKKRQRTLLCDIQADFLGGHVNAIMGPSGSGKTSLLSFLGGRLAKTNRYTFSGELTVNSGKICSQKLAQIAAFVAQHDQSLIPTLTVRETLFYQAKLRLAEEEHSHIPSIIDRLIRQTGLVDCADTTIGSETVKGISGGEKRRVSIATQLLSKPKIIFLDEPTSGLDSATALSIMILLQELARNNGTTVILTIHQPSEAIFATFNTILLLAKGGKPVFSGNPAKIGPFLSLAGLEPPPGANMADFLLDVVSKGDETEEQLLSRVEALQSEWSKVRKTKPSPQGHFDASQWRKKKAPFWTIFLTITRRQFVNSLRSLDILFSRGFQVVLLAITHTLFFAPLRNTAAGIDNRLGLVQEVLNLYFVGLINNIALFPTEREIFYQEYRDGVCGPFEFNLAYLVNEVPLELISCAFFSILVVFGVGLPRNASMLFGMLATCFISVNVGDSLGIIMNSIFRHTGMATNFLANLVTVGFFMGGTMSIQLPPFFQAWNYLSPMRYAVLICTKLGFQNQNFACGSEAESCTLRTGREVLKHYNLENNLGVSLGGLVACLVMYRVIAIGAVYMRVRWFV